MTEVRLLLTSSGITNPAIAEALAEMLTGDIASSNLAFVPTAANIETGDKGWLIDDFVYCRAMGFRQIDIVDPSALRPTEWQSRLEDANVIVMGGGCTPFLLDQLEQTGVGAALPSLLEERVYVGISAGSIAAGRQAVPALSNDHYEDDTAPCLRSTTKAHCESSMTRSMS